MLTKVHIVKDMVFLVVRYGCESWTVKKAEPWRTDAFELHCQRRLLRVPWTTWRSNQLILKDINPKYSLERLMLKLQYFGHLKWLTHWKRPWFWERLKAGKRDGWMASLSQWTWVWTNSGRWWRTAKPGVLQSMGSQRVRDDLLAKQYTQKWNWWSYGSSTFNFLSNLHAVVHSGCANLHFHPSA